MGDLIIRDEALGSIALVSGMDALLKPLERDIELLEVAIAGTFHIPDKSVFDEVREGVKLTLLREKENEYDENAILVLAPSGRKIGYVPKRHNTVFARLMDAGKDLFARVVRVHERSDDFMSVTAMLCLVDF